MAGLVDRPALWQSEVPLRPRTQALLFCRAMKRLALFTHRVLSALLGDPRARRFVGQIWAVGMLVGYSVKAQYARAMLGLLWALLTPLLFLAVYVPLFTYVYNADTAGLGDSLAFPLYVVAGFLGWSAFQEGLTQGATTLVHNPGLIKHSPAPAGLLPFVKVASSFIGLAAGSCLLLLFLGVAGRWPGVRLALWPIAAGLWFLFTWGAALFMAALVIYLRDLTQILATILSVEFFACPLIWHTKMVPAHLQAWVQANPLTPFLNLLRAAFLPGLPFAWLDLLLACGWAGFALLCGRFVFLRLQAGFADAV